MNIETIDQLEAIYGRPGETATVKVSRTIIPEYHAYIEISRFACLATVGPEGLDCSPRGDCDNLVRVVDPSKIQMPDRRGNNRIDSLRNIVRDSRVALLMLIPGHLVTLRINGRATLSVDRGLLDSFAIDNSPPRSVIEIAVEEVYFQCGRAVLRSGLWKIENQVDPTLLPSPGQILARMSDKEFDGDHYDAEWPERARRTMW